MRQARRRDTFEAFLSGEVVLAALLGAALALFLSRPALRAPYDLPQVRLVLWSLYTAAAALLSVLTAIRFGVERRRYELMLFAGFSTLALSWAVFAVGPAVVGRTENLDESWASLAGILAGWIVIASAPFVRGAVGSRRAALAETFVFVVVGLVVIGWVSAGTRGHETSRVAAAALLALVTLVAAIGFGERFRRRREDLDRFLALGATLALAASVEAVFEPLTAVRYVTQGDFVRLLAYALLVVGVCRAMLASELGRAVAEERARVAREIHDGLSQYLFAVSTHAAMLRAGADPGETLPKLEQAVHAAQGEARFATLALSSAAGSARFDASLRRYVDVLTADGALEVELELDPAVRLAPDEQIEVFRIVQEGLANARKHAAAGRAWVTIGRRGTERLVTVSDDGAGFEPPDESATLGLANMRSRAAAIGGAFSLRSAPGCGTAVEVVLRS
jgi:signal transduction histidine kinase